MKRIVPITTVCMLLSSTLLHAQEINTTTSKNTEPELKHYMPLYLDIPAELNVKKGFQEVNVAGGYADYKHFNGVRTLLEYDFAPVDRLGIEIEVPFVFVHNKTASVPAEHENTVHEEGGAAASAMGLRIGFNYSVHTFAKAKTTLAAGYFNELETAPFKSFGKPVFTANIYNPFIAAAKIWGERFHTMIYAGPAIKQEFESRETITQYKLNTILSWRFGKRDKETFAAVECNQAFAKDNKPQLLLRPQVQLQLTERWKLGLVAGIPVKTASGLNGSGFFRLIYSPAIKKKSL